MSAPRITAYALFTPWGTDPEVFWQQLAAGENCFTPSADMSSAGLDPLCVAQLPLAAPNRFEKCLDNLLSRCHLDDRKTALCLATTLGDFFDRQVNSAQPADIKSINGFVEKLAQKYGLTGPVCVHTCACISGLTAMEWSRDILAAGLAERCVILALDVLSSFTLSGFSCLKALTSEKPRPFDQRASGFCLGEAGAMLVLEPEADRSASVEGIGIANDADQLIRPHPHAAGMILAITQALSQAGITPSQISMINAHGAATRANDQMEMAAFRHFWGGDTPPYLTAIKSQTGHCLTGSAILEMIFCLLSAQKGMILPICNLSLPQPDLVVRTVSTPTPHPVKYILKISNSFGGNNAAVVVKNNDM